MDEPIFKFSSEYLAAWDYSDKVNMSQPDKAWIHEAIKNAFLAGIEYQKKQDESK